MRKKSLLFLAVIAFSSGILPVFAEVTEIQLDKNSYLKGDSINVKGIVTSDSSGLVTIVLRDPNDKFVLLSQSFIQSDDSFEKTIPINEKFLVPGTYNATAFVLNMTAGKTQSFNFDSIITKENSNSNANLPLSVTEIEDMIREDSKIIDAKSEPEIIDNQIKQEPPIENQQKKLDDEKYSIADFVDKNKEPQYYLDRYYNEAAYKLWFDKNYPNLTIEEAVGYSIITEIESTGNNVGTGIILEAEALSSVPSSTDSENNSEFAHLGLAVGGLVVLFGAVYGIKKKVDNNSHHISLNKDLIRRKIIAPIITPNPIGIIQTRLAKGEISIEEYEQLRQKLDKNSI